MRRILPALIIFFVPLSGAITSAQQDVGPTYEHLKDMEIFVGDWEFKGPMVTGDKKEEISVIASYRWIQNKAFMLVTLQDTRTKEIAYVGIMGWDPDKKHVMSWDFNLMGIIFTYYQGRSEEGWWLKGTGRMPDGATIDFRALYTLVDDNTMDYKGSGTITKDGKKTPVTLEFPAKRIKR